MTTIDESLFGVRDFGALTLPEFAGLFAGVDGCDIPDIPVLKLLSCRLGHIAYSPYPLMLITPIDPTGVEKIKELLNVITNAERKYAVKFEIAPEDLADPRFSHFGPLAFHTDPRFFHISIFAFVDEVCVYHWNWWPSFTNKFTNAMDHLNTAHEKYLHALHYAQFRANMARITEELVADAMHPRRLIRHLDLGGDIEDF